MAYLKCEIGKPLVLAVDDVAYNVKGKFGVQTVFHAGDDSFAMNPESAAKQLAHANIADPIGLTLEFSKVDIGQGRTAINIKQVGATSGPKGKDQPFDQPAPPTHQTATLRPAAGFDGLLYAEITDWVIANIMPKYEPMGCGWDGATVASIVATIYIQANKH